MKILGQILLTLVIVAAALAGAYFWLEQKYASQAEITETRTDLAQAQTLFTETNAALTTLRGEMDRLQGDLSALKTVAERTDATLATLPAELAAVDLAAIDAQLTAARTAIADLQADVFSKAETQALLQQRLNADKADIQALLDQKIAALKRPFRAVDIELGKLPLDKTQQLGYPVPAAIPDDASEILIYVYVKTGYVTGGPHQFKIAVLSETTGEAAFYLYAAAHEQQEYSYNSENFWLPMPKDRKIIVYSNGERLFGEWESKVKITGYR